MVNEFEIRPRSPHYDIDERFAETSRRASSLLRLAISASSERRLLRWFHRITYEMCLAGQRYLISRFGTLARYFAGETVR